jgi:hypothetical protein
MRDRWNGEGDRGFVLNYPSGVLFYTRIFKEVVWDVEGMRGRSDWGEVAPTMGHRFCVILSRQIEFNPLQIELNPLQIEFDSLQIEFDSLQMEFDSLQIEFDSLRIELNLLFLAPAWE